MSYLLYKFEKAVTALDAIQARPHDTNGSGRRIRELLNLEGHKLDDIIRFNDANVPAELMHEYALFRRDMLSLRVHEVTGAVPAAIDLSILRQVDRIAQCINAMATRIRRCEQSAEVK